MMIVPIRKIGSIISFTNYDADELDDDASSIIDLIADVIPTICDVIDTIFAIHDVAKSSDESSLLQFSASQLENRLNKPINPLFSLDRRPTTVPKRSSIPKSILYDSDDADSFRLLTPQFKRQIRPRRDIPLPKTFDSYAEEMNNKMSGRSLEPLRQYWNRRHYLK